MVTDDLVSRAQRVESLFNSKSLDSKNLTNFIPSPKGFLNETTDISLLVPTDLFSLARARAQMPGRAGRNG